MRCCQKLLRSISKKSIMTKEQNLLKEMINATPQVSSAEIFKKVGKPDDALISLTNFEFAVMKKRYEYVKANFHKIKSEYDYIRLYVDPETPTNWILLWIANLAACGMLGLYLYQRAHDHEKYDFRNHNRIMILSVIALTLTNIRMHNVRKDRVLQIIYNSKIDKLYIEKFKKIYGTYFQTLNPIDIKPLSLEFVAILRPKCTYINRTTMEHYSTYSGRWINDEIFLYLLHRSKQPLDNYKLIE